MNHKVTHDCFVCINGPFFKWMRILQTVLTMQCPHQNKNVHKIEIKVSHFWTNIQYVVVLILIHAMYSSWVDYHNSKTEEEYLYNFARMVVFVMFTVPFQFLFTKNQRLNEVIMYQRLYDKVFEMYLPNLFVDSDLCSFRKIHLTISLCECVFLGTLISYASFMAYLRSRYTVWIIEICVTIASTNVLLCYCYLYFVGYKMRTNLNKQLINWMSIVFLDDTVNVVDKIKRYVDLMKLFNRSVQLFLSYRGHSILCVTLCIIAAGVIFFYGGIKLLSIIFYDEFMYRAIHGSTLFLLHTSLCCVATMLENSVNNIC